MTPSRSNRSLLVALYVNAALIFGLIVAVLAKPGSHSLVPAAMGQDMNIAGGGGVFLMPGQIAPNTWGVYLMDIDSQTLMVYQYTPGDNELKLKAARSYQYDRKLKTFNVGAPTPDEVKKMLEEQAAPQRGAAGPAGSGSMNAPSSPDKK